MIWPNALPPASAEFFCAADSLVIYTYGQGVHFLEKLWCSWIDLFQQTVFPCFLSLTSSHACTYASLIKQQATVCSVGLLLSVWLPPLSYCSSVLLECSRPCACCEDRSYSGASPASGVRGE